MQLHKIQFAKASNHGRQIKYHSYFHYHAKGSQFSFVPDIFLTSLQCFGKAINMRCRLLPTASISL